VKNGTLERGCCFVDAIDFGTNLALRQVQGLPQGRTKVTASEATPGKALESFGQILKNHLAQVNELEEVADRLVEDYAVGKPVELHNVIISHEKADLAMELTMQLRNKGIAAYQEIWRMNI
jgi:flagellar hook-basal body complex protein FliE